MSTDTFRLAGIPRADGRMYLTSPDLPGFRLLINPESDSFMSEIEAALMMYVPHHLSALARRKQIVVKNDKRMDDCDTSSPHGMHMVASFVPA